MKAAFSTTGRELGKQSRMSDRVECLRYVQGVLKCRLRFWASNHCEGGAATCIHLSDHDRIQTCGWRPGCLKIGKTSEEIMDSITLLVNWKYKVTGLDSW